MADPIGAFRSWSGGKMVTRICWSQTRRRNDERWILGQAGSLLMVGRRHDKTGRSTHTDASRRAREANKPPAGEPFVWLTRSLMESPAWRALSGNARLVIDRVLIEHMAHGGHENGCLPVTYDDLEKYGLRRNSIRPSIAEAVALGLLEHQPGRAARGSGKGWPQSFRIVWLPDQSGEPAKRDWQRFETLADAKRVAQKVRLNSVDARQRAKRQLPPKI